MYTKKLMNTKISTRKKKIDPKIYSDVVVVVDSTSPL